MNIFSIVEELEKIDPELNDRLDPRRSAIKNITSFGSKVAIAALPFALGTLFKKAYGQSLGDPVSVLNYALKLEYLEAEFYNIGAGTPNLIPASYLSELNTIKGHENAHVTFLQTVITQLGGTPVARSSQGFGASAASVNGSSVGPKYDFTGGSGSGTGPFAGVFGNFDLFLALGQVFEDTGVRAYKGQAPNIIGNKTVLTAALNIHSVEARHAAHLRQLRRARATVAGATFTAPTLKPWISGTAANGNDTGVAAADANYGAGTTAATYPSESNTVQGGVTITNLAGVSGNVSAAAAWESFDEPLDAPAVVNLVKIFGVA